MIQDHIHEDLDAPCVGLAHELAEFLVGSEVGINLEEIEDPIPVITGGATLDGLVAEGRCDPNGGGAESLEVVEPLRESGEVSAVKV